MPKRTITDDAFPENVGDDEDDDEDEDDDAGGTFGYEYDPDLGVER